MNVKDLFDLGGKVAIVTGGSRGLGLEIAEALAEAGAGVSITGRRREWLDSAEASLRDRGFEVLAIDADVADPEGVRRTVDSTVGRFGGVDVLVNNAGLSWLAPSLEYPLDKWQLQIQVNLTGVWMMCQAVAPHMISRGGGAILNMGSIAGLLGIAPEIQDTVAYNAAKGGVHALTRDLAVKWARHGINVNAIAPGYFRTRMTEYLYQTVEEQMTALAPMKRLGAPGELKGVAVFLCSRAASYVTGQVIAIDGGMSVW